MWVRGRELLSSPLATLSLADQNIFVFLMESQTFPITLFSPSHPSFSLPQPLSNMGRFVHSVTVCGQQTDFTLANNHFVAYDHKLPVSQTCAKLGSFRRYF